MKASAEQLSNPAMHSFRRKLLISIMLAVSSMTATVLYYTQRKVVADAAQAFQTAYLNELDALQRLHDLRTTALAERCKSLVRRPRIHASLEDNALDLLYPSARDELRDVMEPPGPNEMPLGALHANFYRFLDSSGTVITPVKQDEVGRLTADEEAQLTLSRPPEQQQTGYMIRRTSDGSEIVNEVIAAPIFSTETSEVIAAIVLGFNPFTISDHDEAMRSGIWVGGHLTLPALSPSAQSEVTRVMSTAVQSQHAESVQITLDHVPHLLSWRPLNAGSMFPPAYEVSIYSLAPSLARQKQLRWQIVIVSAVVLIGSLGISHLLSTRLSLPVEKLAEDSLLNREGRRKAEAALELTSVELQRAARFSADASHQLKTPVTVLRAGLEELQQQPGLTAETREEITGLIYQTARLTGMIHDLLLLSRMDAGRLQLDFSNVDLTQLIDSLADDLSAVPEGPDFDVEVDVPRDLHILGEKRYTSIILHNLLENAWKYNVPRGLISVTAHEHGDYLLLTVGNSGPGIPADAQEHIFEQFHRGAMGEGIPGHGLGLNLARELARLHGGDLRLIQSQDGWTEFEVCFRIARVPVAP